MIAYIKLLAKEIEETLSGFSSRGDIKGRFCALLEETERLDPRDFLPSEQFAFVNLRRMMRHWAKMDYVFWKVVKECRTADAKPGGPIDQLMEGATPLDNPNKVLMWANAPHSSVILAYQKLSAEIEKSCASLRSTLDSYGGKDCRLIQRTFPFIANADLRKIIERDYRELSMILFPGSAWKSTVVMAGSILEAILYDQLTKDAATVQKAMAASTAPKKNKGKAVRDITSDKMEDDWKLKNLIEVSVELNIIDDNRAGTIDQALRDFRNFVHARAEIGSGHELTEAEALTAKGALDGVCNQLK